MKMASLNSEQFFPSRSSLKDATAHRRDQEIYTYNVPSPFRKLTPVERPIIGKLKQAWFNTRIHTYYESDLKTGQKIAKQRELPSLKALGKDGFCRWRFCETRLLDQLLLVRLIYYYK
jgi:hypothetical protein